MVGGGGAPVADYIVLAESRPKDLNDGTWAATASREQEYRFHLPKSATEACRPCSRRFVRKGARTF